MAQKLYTAIVFFPGERTPAKYRKLAENRLDKFKTFCCNASAAYFNLYEKESKRFVKRVYCN